MHKRAILSLFTMKDHIYSIHIAIVLIFVLNLLAFRPTLGKKKPPSSEEAFALSKLLVRVGDYLAQHKFFERDRRKPRPDEQPVTFMERFPDPPLALIPDMIRGECDKGVLFCLKHINFLSYKKLTRMDLFTLRVSASYYMCWYTMQEEPLLRHFGTSCQVSYRGNEDRAIDYRGWDKMPFDCALHSFCPDPCCGSYQPLVGPGDENWQSLETPKGFARTQKLCARRNGYPCGITELACSLDLKQNRNWHHLIKNKLNTTCTCGKVGKNFYWEERFKMCVDQDECRDGNYDCEPDSICRNIESDYYCTCRLGYKFSSKELKCVRDTDFEMDDILRVQAGVLPGMTAAPSAQTAEFKFATYFYWLIDHSSSDEANRNQRQYSVAIWAFALGVNFYQCIIVYD